MLIILIFIALLIIGDLLMNAYSDIAEISGIIISIFAIFAIIIALFVWAFNYIGVSANKEAAMEKYNTIQYKISSDAYKDDIGLLNKDIVDEICEWNSDLKWNQKMTHNAFIGILIPNYYDDLEFIELPDK